MPWLRPRALSPSPRQVTPSLTLLWNMVQTVLSLNTRKIPVRAECGGAHRPNRCTGNIS